MQLVIDGHLIGYEILNPKAKRTLLILHGWGHHSQVWLPVANALSHDVKIVVIDLPGFGKSQHLAWGSGVPEYSDFVAKFIKKLDLKKPIVLGHSFGGQIALYLAHKHPELVSRLILVSPAGIRTKTQKQKVKVFLYKRFKYLKYLLPRPILSKIIKRFTSTDYLNASPEHKAVLKKIVTQDLSSVLSEINVKTDLIWGELDKEIPYAGKQICNALPDCQLHILYGADHNPHLSKVTELTKVLNQIL
jgi:pimeloyl-ACP methyl ester carboxylesterase